VNPNIYHVLKTALMQDLNALNPRRGAVEHQHVGSVRQVCHRESSAVEQALVHHATAKVGEGVGRAF